MFQMFHEMLNKLVFQTPAELEWKWCPQHVFDIVCKLIQFMTSECEWTRVGCNIDLPSWIMDFHWELLLPEVQILQLSPLEYLQRWENVFATIPRMVLQWL